MADFVCKVADANGHVFSHVEVAHTLEEARQKLQERGLFVYSVRPQGGFVGAVLQRKRTRAVGGNDFLVFNQQFNTLIKAGLPILKSLELLSERVAAPRLRPVLIDVRRRVREGALLSEALAEQGSFPKVYTISVLAGEKSGNLPGVLDYFIAYQRVTTGIRKKLIAALIYPAILVFAAISIVTYVVAYVIPQFARLYADMNITLPLATRILIAIAVGFRPFLLAAVALVIAAGLAVYFWSRTEAGGVALDRIKLKLPFVGNTWIKFQIAQFCRTLSTLLTGGTPLVQALDTSAQSITSKLVGDAVRESAKLVREGQSLHSGLSCYRDFSRTRPGNDRGRRGQRRSCSHAYERGRILRGRRQQPHRDDGLPDRAGHFDFHGRNRALYSCFTLLADFQFLAGRQRRRMTKVEKL